MRMPHVIADSIRNPGRHSGEGRDKDWIAAPGSRSGTGYAAMTVYFHINLSGGIHGTERTEKGFH